ncbi:MAG TPA: response regulator transcription factor [Acidimicrobiales bacterium]|nr:response regulator transcription factor [Acidimicrobiales bacterium]
MAVVLAVDDDPALLRALGIGLKALGHHVATAATGERGLSEAAVVGPDVVVLDLGLPDLDGMEVCRRIRQWSDVPIIVLSADGTDDRKIAALDGGADDYMTKPFSMGELDARLRVAIRHRRVDDDVKQLQVGTLHLDMVHCEAAVGERRLELTAREFALLAFLARHVDKVCTHRMILQAVWGPRYGTEIEYLRVYAYRLRRKLGDDNGVALHTVPGVGYRLTVTETA